MNNRRSQDSISVALLGATIVGSLIAPVQAEKIRVPEISGLKVRAGETVRIPNADSSILHQFEDGRIVIVGKEGGIWSTDGGRTWHPGPSGLDDKTTINLGDGEVLSINRTSGKRPSSKYYYLSQRRSHDDWKTVEEEEAILDTPLAITTGTDDGSAPLDGLLMHHGAVRLENGDLIATMYGNYQGDTDLADGYQAVWRTLKHRTVVVFSSDVGKSWGDPVTVAYDQQLGRGTDPDSSVQTAMSVPAVTQEGFCEADLTRAKNGTLVWNLTPWLCFHAH